MLVRHGWFRVLALLIAVIPAARAQFAVIDVASLSQLVSEVQVLEQHYFSSMLWAGVGLAFGISRGSAAASGMAISFHLDGPVVAGACGIALASALLAALAPARRAARLCVVGALG